MALIEIIGFLTSSIIYSKRRLGSAIKISVIAGRIVQIISINCPSNRYRWINLLKSILINICLTKIVIIIRINSVWSWKNINCSIRGEALSWRIIVFQVEISKKSLNFIIGV